jgi:murein DD-endopeptidase MepM/ murein hydrolase activator NlpD
VDRRNEPVLPYDNEQSNTGWAAPLQDALPLASADARWAFVSTSLMTLIVGSIAWLAIQTMPPSDSRGFATARGEFVPYRLFQELRQGGNSLFASLGTSNPRTDRANSQVAQPAIAFPPPGKPADANPGVENRTITLDSGDTLAGALEDAGVSADDANAAVAAMSKVFNPRNLRAGLAFDLTLTTPKTAAGDSGEEPSAQLTSLKFSPTIEHDIAVTRAADGSFTANDAVKQLTAQVHHAGTTIDSSLYISAMQAGIPADVVVEMIHMFSYKVDFQRDIHPGDSFEVFYDYYYTPQGQPAKVGNVSFARMRLGGKDIAMYRFQSDPNSPTDYYDAKGQSAKGVLMKTPVDGARITSGFGMRFHPVLGYTRMHKGIDFGVPVGTPVMAAGAGTVTFVGWQNGYGKFVKINHGNGLSTGYGHLSGFAAGLHIGSRVRQAQIIARSGMTGIATGPHLHFETSMRNVQVNPLKLKLSDGRKLAGRDLKKFLGERAHIDAMMVSSKLETKVADISGTLKPGAK